MAKMKVLIGGGQGFVGRHLSRLLGDNGYQPIIVSRDSNSGHMTWHQLESDGIPHNCTAIVNLAGLQFLTSARWTEDLKDQVRSSRIDTTVKLVNAIRMAQYKPRVYVGMTGVGYYEPSVTAEYTEDSEGGRYDFFARLVRDWEAASDCVEEDGVRRVIVRSGVVLGRDGGMIRRIYLPFYLGLGGRIGSGTQWFPWIHIDDITGIIVHSILNPEVSGILNGTAPKSCTNAEFTREFSRSLRRFAVFPVPSLALNLMLGKERASVMLEGAKVIPKRTLESGYKFLYPTIREACNAL